MTTIVANSEGMASDSRACGGITMISVGKFWRVNGWLIGGAGTADEVLLLVAEIRAHKDKTPVEVLETTDFSKVAKNCDLLLLSPAGKLYLSEEGGSPLTIKDKFAAIGTGSQGAMVAMHLGATLQEAVRAVKLVDPNTGGRIVTRKL